MQVSVRSKAYRTKGRLSYSIYHSTTVSCCQAQPHSSMARPHPKACALLAAAITLLLTVSPVTAVWLKGRATYFGAPTSFGRAFDEARGKGPFGILSYGSCGFTNNDGSLPLNRDAVAAAADASADYAGSCGRCYAVRCRNGLVLGNDGAPINITDFFYLPSVSRDLPDTQGRRWPGNPEESQGLSYTTCWDESKEVIVRIADSCPCTQVLPDGAPGVAAGGEVRQQSWCCGGTAGIQHFDLSYWAFEQLAHPLSGTMMLEFNTVDCSTGAELPYGYVNRDVIYNGETKPGWGWFTYGQAYGRYAVANQGPGNVPATCVQLTKDGGLSFTMKGGNKSGLQPFAGVTAISVWLKSDAQAQDAAATSTPPGQPVNVKAFIMNDATDQFCNAEVFTGNWSTPVPGPDGWFRHEVPFEAFKCDYDGALPSQVHRIDFQNVAEQPALFCLNDLRMLR